MNERIRELAVQADLLIKKSNGNEFRYGNLDPKFEKFAELIVRECAEVSEQSQWLEAKGEYYEGFNEAMIYVANKIKKHFGVEIQGMNDE
jgi:hypothetical protein